ncbi:MAG: TauD/TfdA family dioxygenase, partial [Proteobacteria bacterium]|nr:TauD/TfdA family dioxygenase [Pseudomonadota bacterium]
MPAVFPPGLPEKIEGPAAWKAADVKPGDWIHELTAEEARTVRNAARDLAAQPRELIGLRAPDFPLPGLDKRLQHILQQDVLNGRGFAVIRGLDPGEFSRREVCAAFLGVGAHLGAARPQNAAGHILGHVRDLGRSSADPTARLYQTHERQTYHTDSCDVVGLMCLRPAKQGGRSSLVSAVAIYNEMRKRRPDLAATLFEPIETDRRGEQVAGQKGYFQIPVFNWWGGHFAGMYQRQYIESARRFDDVKPLTDRQIEALDLLDRLADDPEYSLEIDFMPGDIQLVNNHVLFHDRTAFEDW